MRRLKRLLAAIIIASTVFLTASFGRAPAETSESDEDVRPDMLAVNSAVVASIQTEAKRVESERFNRARLTKLKRIADEAALKRKQSEVERKRNLARIAKAKADAKRKQAPSRSQAYVGKAQAFTATAYTAYCAGCSGITRTGHDLRKSIYEDGYRVIATDPRYIPLGSIVCVTLTDGSTFEAVASDTGGAIKGHIVDIAHETKAQAMQFGRQSVEIRMIRKGR